MNDLSQLIGVGLIVFAILGALVLGYFLGYRHGSGHWR